MGHIKDLYNKEFWNIYRWIKKYKQFYISKIPFEDVAQEILIGIMSDGDKMNNSSKNVSRLIKDYGYNVTLKSKDAFDPAEIIYETDPDRDSYLEWVENTVAELKEFYKNKSAKWILTHYNIPLTNYALISISRLIGGKKKHQRNVVPYDKHIAEKIFMKNNISRNAFRQWKYVGYIPKKYINNL